MNALAQTPGDDRDDKQVEALEIDLLLSGLARRYGYDFRDYARAALTRRIRRTMQEQSLATVSALQSRLLHDSAAMMRFVDTVSTHPTTMFRDAAFYRVLRDKVIPVLRTYPFVRIWHAGCSTGEEVYSLAILLHEEELYERCRIYATDVSDGALEHARKGIYPLAAMHGYAQAYDRAGGQQSFSRYYAADHEHAIIRTPLRKNLVFSQHNLVSDAPFNEFQLIICRNVMLYFNPTLSARVQRVLHDSSSHFGLLALGRKEALRGTAFEAAYQPVDEDTRIFRRVG